MFTIGNTNLYDKKSTQQVKNILLRTKHGKFYKKKIEYSTIKSLIPTAFAIVMLLYIRSMCYIHICVCMGVSVGVY